MVKQFYNDAHDALIDTLHQMSVHGESDALCDLAADLATDFRLDGIVPVFTEAKSAGSRYVSKFRKRALDYLIWLQLVGLASQVGMHL